MCPMESKDHLSECIPKATTTTTTTTAPSTTTSGQTFNAKDVCCQGKLPVASALGCAYIGELSRHRNQRAQQ